MAWRPKPYLFKKGTSFFWNKNACGHLFSSKHGLGLPIHIKRLSILINIRYEPLLVLNRPYTPLPVVCWCSSDLVWREGPESTNLSAMALTSARPGPCQEGVNSYSAQEGINSKGNTIKIFIREIRKSNNRRNLLFVNAFWIASTFRIQPERAHSITNERQHTTNGFYPKTRFSQKPKISFAIDPFLGWIDIDPSLSCLMVPCRSSATPSPQSAHHNGGGSFSRSCRHTPPREQLFTPGRATTGA